MGDIHCFFCLVVACTVYNCSIFHFHFWGWVLWNTGDVGRGGQSESFVVVGWGLVFFFWCSLSPCHAIVYIVVLYFFVCWIWFFRRKGILHFLFCHC